jgi:SAM-dependent methyltransferase
VDRAKDILQEQIAYYRARAPEYDRWFLRQGRYDRGEAHRQQWLEEVGHLEAALARSAPAGDILELACGTGIWTSRLAPRAAHLTAVDASPEALAINRSRLLDPAVEYVQADLFAWTPTRLYDYVFFGFWLSHVPPERFEGFWRLVGRALRPGGRAFFVDSRDAPEGTAHDQQIEIGGTVDRRLDDGRTFRIVKVFYQPDELSTRLGQLGWTAEVEATPTFFIHGSAARV